MLYFALCYTIVLVAGKPCVASIVAFGVTLKPVVVLRCLRHGIPICDPQFKSATNPPLIRPPCFVCFISCLLCIASLVMDKRPLGAWTECARIHRGLRTLRLHSLAFALWIWCVEQGGAGQKMEAHCNACSSCVSWVSVFLDMGGGPFMSSAPLVFGCVCLSVGCFCLCLPGVPPLVGTTLRP